MNSGLMTIYEAAEYLNLTDRTLRQWKHYGRGPAFYKLGGKLMYRKQDIDDWIETNRHEPATEVS